MVDVAFRFFRAMKSINICGIYYFLNLYLNTYEAKNIQVTEHYDKT